MNRLIAILIALPLAAQVPQSYHGTSGGWGPLDRNHPMHFWAGAIVGAPAFLVAEHLGYGDPKATSWAKRNLKPWMHAIFWSTAAGLWKENYDRKHGGRPEWGDAAYTTLGGASIAFAIPLMRGGGPKAYATAPPLPLELEPPRPAGPCCPDDPE